VAKRGFSALRELCKAKNGEQLQKVFDWFLGDGRIFADLKMHGKITWDAQQLVVQALCWAWQDAATVNDAFDRATELCKVLKLTKVAKNYTTFMNGLDRQHRVFVECLRKRLQAMIEGTGGRFWRDQGWVLLAFDGSRASTPRTQSLEKAFCAPTFGQGKTAKYRKKKSKGMRRKQNERNKAQPQRPQIWITMLWHMVLRVSWTWRLGPSNASERQHVREILEEEEMPKNTLFCGDAGFVGYDFWRGIVEKGHDFLVRVGANVTVLGDTVRWQKMSDGRVLCWPKDKMRSGEPPLELRLVLVKVGKTQMWMLTSVLCPRKLTKKGIVRYYKMRWGIEIEFRGLKQTLDNRILRCRTSTRALVELDWAIRGMAFAELAALREQIAACERQKNSDYTPRDRSLAETVRALRYCMRNPHTRPEMERSLRNALRAAVVQRYRPRTEKHARYRPRNPDKKPLGDPTILPLTSQHRDRLRLLNRKKAA
jgi:hypothetical protein